MSLCDDVIHFGLGDSLLETIEGWKTEWIEKKGKPKDEEHLK